MIIKQRQVRKPTRFRSKFARDSGKRREYAASILATAVVQGLLVIFLVISGFRSYGLLRDKFEGMGTYVRVGVPLGTLIIALVVLRAFVNNLRRAAEIRKTAGRTPPSD